MKTSKLLSVLLSFLMLFGVIGATGISAYAAQNPKSVSLSTATYTYDGKVKKPKVIAKDGKGKTIDSKYYTVAYPSGRKNVGSYTVSVKFKGKFKGTKSLKFKIVPKGTTVSSVTADVKSFTVKFKKQATQTTGYQVQYATNSSFKSVTVKTIGKNTTTSCKVNAKGNQKYYVRVRTYKKVGKSNYYSAWSKASTVTTKSGLRFQRSEYTVYNGQTITFSFSGASNLTWSTSNKNVATVDKNGKVTALQSGTCTITVKSPDDKATVKIAVPENCYENESVVDIGAFFGVDIFSYNNKGTTVTKFYELSDIECKDSNWQSNYLAALESRSFAYLDSPYDEENDIHYDSYRDVYGNVVLIGVYVFPETGESYLVFAYNNINGKSLTD